MIVPNCSSKCGQHLRFVSLNMIRLNVRALSYVNVIFRILLRFWYFLWLEDDFDLSSFTYDPLRYFCYPFDTKSGQALAFVEDTKIQSKTKNYIFVKIFFFNSDKGYFFSCLRLCKNTLFTLFKATWTQLAFYLYSSVLNTCQSFVAFRHSFFLFFQEAFL